MPDGRRQEPGGWNRIVLTVDDLASQIASLEKAGVRFRNQTEEGPGANKSWSKTPTAIRSSCTNIRAAKRRELVRAEAVDFWGGGRIPCPDTKAHRFGSGRGG